TSEATASASNIRFRDNLADSLEASLHRENDLVTFDRLVVKRKENDFAVTGEYRLPKGFHNLDQQPAKIGISFNAGDLADFWKTDSPDKIVGPLQASGQIEWKNGIANGQLSIFGANLRMRDLVFTQLDLQCIISNSVVYLNDVSARLNDQEFLSAWM